ncbi:glycyl-radical enzyme activating protein [Lonepinella koalarum]|uniref:Cobalamin-independent glycerol dehydratase small subunit n=1 Tax=Lonepinella koalarum TaxID=53417 RepID=A0A4R1KR72_9PAST|nr:glycyl-radical enzyme activating protein [Lonepinella koalarum]MDH2926659.1 glycyl-radical enzyme activating protein [Lonepinella koalarum]TCK66983.1 cobalamin-independent glycerol dehydratase small subunit [Lonepinella koalarum]TFJ88948.1 glycyl-radical enzyme activating protein [Lonepinella koalarum]
MVNYDAAGVIFNIQRYSLHDGPGIRTIPFFKGCPLACKWCSNPESQKPNPELMFQPDKCVHCGKCIETCQYSAISHSNPFFVDHDRCVDCGACAEVCPTSALFMKGKRVTVKEVIQELQKDESTYRRSGGGITLSGGEALSQPEFATELLKACKSKGWHTAIETTGLASKEVIESVFPFVDLALVDIKVINPQVHRENTGVDNRLILENVIRISYITETIVRIPVIIGVNNDLQSIRAIAEFTQLMHNVKAIHLLPYHNYGENKYALLGRIYPMKSHPDSIDTITMNSLKIEVEKLGIPCQIGG